MGVPVVAVATGAASGYLKGKEAERRERNIADRVSKYASFSDAKLYDIIKTYGGEMGEAAQRVLSSRGSAAQSTAPAPTVTERLAQGSPDMGMIVLGVGALLVLFLFLRK